ncbi:hypothetical protein [Streptomyces sp. DSM 15324]|uniref:hypothetical protein n=1 Tax=Streptomyces sp. DSM 15324 TaxID=1739111 RepID=UPI0007469BE1|nr:hypothetical protein [Streptomyces sp. DSM 15324]KUO07877.1 hypothetical protein AQJ58_33530 [Streptomyces sp. DSM 15324]
MPTDTANRDSRLSLWRRVREFAVPPSMIETATARRLAGDWAGACAAAGVDVDFTLRSVARAHGRPLAARVRADLRRLAPDLLRWHMPRIAPDGLLRPSLTLTLARYDPGGPGGARPVHLVVRTAPAWADAGQRMSLAVWDSRPADRARHHPHPCPDRRFRLDLHRHLWDAERAGELGARVLGAGPEPGVDPALVPPGFGCAVGRWADEARLLLAAEGRPDGTGTVLVRLGGRRRLALEPAVREPGGGPTAPRITGAPTGGAVSALPVLPDAATWVLPDLELLRTGAIDADLLHPLVAAALVPDRPRGSAPRSHDPAGRARLVECRGARHRIGLVDGVLAALDHDPDEIRREELLAALTGTPLPCLQAVDRAHRHPDCLDGVRERLAHGDIAGALAVVEDLLGPEAPLRDGALRDALEEAAHRRITYGLFRAGLTGAVPTPVPPRDRRPPDLRWHPRHGTLR